MQRILSIRLFIAALTLLCAASSLAAESSFPKVHVYQSGESGIFANAYLIETEFSVVAIDATLSNTDSKALRAKLDALHKPLVAVLLTHGHPDHYNGVTNLRTNSKVPVVSTMAVAAVIRRDDAAKEAQWKPVFKDDWPSPRTFPTRMIAGGVKLTFDGVTFTVHDLGAGESHADSIWIVTSPSLTTPGTNNAFIGDVVLNGVHAYLSDGHSTRWLQNIERVRKLTTKSSRLYPGHGDAGGPELLDYERDYLNAYRRAVADLAAGKPQLTDAQKDQLEARMLEYQKTDRLKFLIKLGADPVAAELAHENGGSDGARILF
jgi:glyoxylase-like metal-dependent hydrolase (beta-lactamase superfamily II)